MTQSRRPSPLQRRVLIVLAALDEKRPGPVLTRDIERVLERSGEAPVYGPNLRASCRRLEDAGWLRTLRAPNLQLAVELTDAGRAVAQPLLPAGGTSATDLPVELNGMNIRPAVGILWCVSTAAPVCSYGIKKAGWYAGRAIRWKWRSGCRPVTMQEWRFAYR